jgi:ligand-binding sensor domain-containing protein
LPVSRWWKKWLTKIPQALGVKIGGIDEIIINASDLWLLSRKASQQSAGLWRSTDNGESWTHYTKNEGLTGNIINDIKIAHNRIWTAAANGLSYSKDNGKNWQHFESGLFSKKTILSLLPAGNQEIYLGSANGLYKLAVADSFFGKKWQDTCIAEIKFLEK